MSDVYYDVHHGAEEVALMAKCHMFGVGGIEGFLKKGDKDDRIEEDLNCVMKGAESGEIRVFVRAFIFGGETDSRS